MTFLIVGGIFLTMCISIIVAQILRCSRCIDAYYHGVWHVPLHKGKKIKRRMRINYSSTPNRCREQLFCKGGRFKKHRGYERHERWLVGCLLRYMHANGGKYVIFFSFLFLFTQHQNDVESQAFWPTLCSSNLPIFPTYHTISYSHFSVAPYPPKIRGLLVNLP